MSSLSLFTADPYALQCQRRLASKRPADEVQVDDSAEVREEGEEIEVVEDEEEEFVSTQR